MDFQQAASYSCTIQVKTLAGDRALAHITSGREGDSIVPRGETSEDTRVEVKSMPGDFGEVTTIIGLVINL